MTFALAATIMTFNVEKHEIGTIQGIFQSLIGVARALGPLALNYIFNITQDGAFLGAGSLFFVSAFAYLILTVSSFALPVEQCNSKKEDIGAETVQGLLNDENGEIA